jgi:hypothetical protein
MLRSLQMLATQNNQDKLAKKMESIFTREAGKFKQYPCSLYPAKPTG